MLVHARPTVAARRAMVERTAPTGLAASLVLLLLASGCLSATPPKTPNQRAAERNAPHVVVPPPVGERTPRPAPTD